MAVTIDPTKTGTSDEVNPTFASLTVSGPVTLSGGTANGVAYLNGSKVLTTGSALTFNGTTLAVTGSISATALTVNGNSTLGLGDFSSTTTVNGMLTVTGGVEGADFRAYTADNAAGGAGVNTASVVFANGGTVKARIRSAVYGDGYMAFHVNDDTERMRLTTGGLAVTGLTTTDTLRVNVTPTAEVVVATHTAVFNINGTNYKFLCLAA